MFACFSKLIERDGRFSLEMFKDLSGEQFFAGRGSLQLIAEKWDLLESVVKAISDRWGGSIGALVAQAEGDAPAVASLIGQTIPGFTDSPHSPRGVLPFQKLAQLATSMMSSGGFKRFNNIESLPVFPDYMLPRVLRHLGILEYSKGLAAAVDSRQVLRAGSLGELAMRWGTVHAADELLQALRESGADVTTPQLDFALWEAAVLGPEADAMGEHHRTIGLAY